MTDVAQGVAVDIRPLSTHAEMEACVAAQRETWGREFAEVVPTSLQIIAQRIGGVAAGAFDPSGTLVGFVFGLTGVENGSIVHWSDMLAVLPAAQNMGIGRRLKEYQRAEMAKVGARVIYWTFDPLVARNAHLNVNVLGVRAVEYVENFYGEPSSPVHRGIGTDRLVVAWPVNEAELAERRNEIARASNNGDGRPRDVIRIEVPRNIRDLQSTDMAAAQSWRQSTRFEFQRAFAAGYRLNGFQSDARSQVGYYLLTR